MRRTTKEIKELDALFSLYVRMRAIKNVGGCERCLTAKHDIQKDNGDIFPAWKQLQCSHFIGRSNKATRYDEDNATGLCGACHIYFTSHPLEHTEWFRKHLGELALDLLLCRARTPAKYVDKAVLEIYYKEKIKEEQKMSLETKQEAERAKEAYHAALAAKQQGWEARLEAEKAYRAAQEAVREAEKVYQKVWKVCAKAREDFEKTMQVADEY